MLATFLRGIFVAYLSACGVRYTCLDGSTGCFGKKKSSAGKDSSKSRSRCVCWIYLILPTALAQEVMQSPLSLSLTVSALIFELSDL